VAEGGGQSGCAWNATRTASSQETLTADADLEKSFHVPTSSRGTEHRRGDWQVAVRPDDDADDAPVPQEVLDPPTPISSRRPAPPRSSTTPPVHRFHRAAGWRRTACGRQRNRGRWITSSRGGRWPCGSSTPPGASRPTEPTTCVPFNLTFQL
jgi:hypothetical protein